MNKVYAGAVILLAAFGTNHAQQYGGMWLPTKLNEKEMKSMGMKISSEDIFSTKKPSIKDAVIQFNKGCTGEIISNQSLILTNHHCGYGAIQKHSSVSNDLLTNGFWAKESKDELPNPGMVVDFVIDVQDVTATMLAGTDGLKGESFSAKLKENEVLLQNKYKLKPYQSLVVKPMYYGNQYYAFTMETYKDIRLVGAPPQSIGKFGSDTDNWVWPRHTGDFSLFRIYANRNNEPAEYAPDNVPYKPKNSLPVSIKGIKENDFTLVYRFPGRTTEYLTSAAIEQVMNVKDPAMIEMREASLKILDEKMRQDPATRIKYASKFASVANYWKKWKGEVEGLQKSYAVQNRAEYEQKLISQKPEIAETINQLNSIIKTNSGLVEYDAYYNELLRNSESLNLAGMYSNFLIEKADGKMTMEKINQFKTRLSSFLDDYDAELDARVTAKLLNIIATKPKNKPLNSLKGFADENVSISKISEYYKSSIINKLDPKKSEKTFQDPENLQIAVEKDPFILLYNNLQKEFEIAINTQLKTENSKISALQKNYMAQMMQADSKRPFFPDANSTLRVTYGQIKGSNPRDGVYYGYQTYLKGVMHKYIPGDYEFDVPKNLVTLYKNKNFGMYVDKSGDVPLCFTATNHTTGGNSGSPALDAYGNLLGLNFDRQWEGTMSDINYDPKFSRNIMVDTRYILFIMDKFANAQRLIKEIKIVK